MRSSHFPLRCFSQLCAMLAILVLPSLVFSQETLFRWKLEPGIQLLSEVVQELEQGIPNSSAPVTQKLTLQQRWEVLSVQQDKSAQVATTLTHAKLSMNIPGAGDVEMDTAKPAEEETGFAKQIGQMFRPMIDVACSNQMSPNGRISQVQIPEAALQGFRNIPMGASMESVLKDSIEKGSPVFPDEPIKPGHIWTQTHKTKTEVGTLEATNQYVYVGTTNVDRNKLHQFSIVTTMNFAGENTFKAKISIPEQKIEGTLLFDNERGYVYSSELNQKMTMRIEIPDQPVIENKLAQKMKTTFRPLPTPKKP